MEGTEYKVNRLETTNLVGPMVDRHWAGLREAKQRNETVAWCAGPAIIWPYAMDMKAHFMAGYAAYCAGRRAGDQVLEVARRDGELDDMCSYHRLHTGLAAAIRDNIPIKEEVVLPLPDVLISSRLCTEMAHYSEILYRTMGIPVINVDMPIPCKEEDIPRLEKFYERQIRESLIPRLEQVCNKPFNYDRMSEILAVSKEAAQIRNECWEFFKKKPTPWTLWDYGVGMGMLFYMMGNPETISYYKKLKEELSERAKNNVPAIMPDGEKYRVMWDGWIPWAFLGKFIRKLSSHGAVPICGRYPWETAFFPEPEKIEPEPDPVHNYCHIWYSGMKGTYHTGPYGGVGRIGELIEEYSIDGVIMFSSKTCRMWNLGQREIVDIIDKRYNIPSVVIEADMIDSAMLSDAQIDTRLQAFFETIDARRG